VGKIMPDAAEEKARAIVGSVTFFAGEDVTRELIEKIAQAIRDAKPKPRKKAEVGTPKIIEAYHDLWRARYGAKPDILGKDVGILSRLTKDLGEDRVLVLLEAFFKMNFLQRRHDPMALQMNIKAVAHFADTNVQISDTQVRQIDKTQSRSDQMKRVMEGEL
jgi:hypothetical protein